MYIYKLFFCIALCFLHISYIIANDFNKKPEWVENFQGKGHINHQNWTIHKEQFNGYQEFYTDNIENIFVTGGKLHIKAIKKKQQNRECTSGRIHTLNKVSFLYGKLEVKAKIPTGKGIFPAIWLLRTDHARTYPLGEIDIMEYIGCFEEKEYQVNIHIAKKVIGKEIRQTYPKKIKANMNKYHIYSLLWYPDKIIFQLDQKEVYRLNKNDVEHWPFDAPYYLILNVAYGGKWGGSCGLDTNIFPCEMCVDWIKYYKLN